MNNRIIEKGGLRAWSILLILICFYQLSFLDKQMYSLLINPVGKALQLTDFQLGLVQGIGFSAFYTLGMILAGWATDVGSRRIILFSGVMLWSAAATLTGLASNLPELYLARAGVGLGEAVMIPCAFSLLATYFARERLAMATGIFMAGANVGGIIAMLAGGSLIATFIAQGPSTWPLFGLLDPWQAAFVVTGLPGLALAFLAFGIPADPKGRSKKDKQDETDGDTIGLWAFCQARPVFLLGVVLSATFLLIVAYAIIIWSPAYFGRVFGWDFTRVGAVVAAGIAAGGVGNILWGWVADRMKKAGNVDALYRLYIAITLIGIPIAILAFTTSDGTVATVSYILTWLFLNSFGPMLSAIQFGIPDHLRGRMVAIKSVVTSLIGLSGGPIIVSAFTDYVFKDPAKIGYSIAITLTIAGIAAVIFLVLTRRAFIEAVLAQEAKPTAE